MTDPLVVARIPPRVLWHLRGVRPLLRPPIVWWRHRGITEHDVALAEYPKSGSTWIAFVLGEALLGEPITHETQATQLPPVGGHARAPRILPGGGRLLRTHERHRSEYRRGIYVVRHVADVAISYHGWLRWLRIPQPPFKRFLPMFLDGAFDNFGPWQANVHSWLHAPDGTVLIVRYEDMLSDPCGNAQRMLGFLHVDVDHSVVAAAVEHNAMPLMRKKVETAKGTVFARRSDDPAFLRAPEPSDPRPELDDDDFELIDRKAGHILRRLGYPIQPSTRSART